MSTFTIKRLESFYDFTGGLSEFCLNEADHLSKLIGHKFDHDKFDYLGYAEAGLFLVCFRDEIPVGVLMARLYPSVFDGKTLILMQDILYAKSGSGRAAWLLMQSFIAFGRENADHILTMRIGSTNIKASSLVKLGFTELETLYRLET